MLAERGVVPGVVGHGVAGRRRRAPRSRDGVRALADHEEGAARAVALQDLEHARRLSRVGAVVEGERDGRLAGGDPDQAPQRQRAPGDQALDRLLGARRAGGELRLIGELRRSGVVLAHRARCSRDYQILCRPCTSCTSHRCIRKNERLACPRSGSPVVTRHILNPPRFPQVQGGSSHEEVPRLCSLVLAAFSLAVPLRAETVYVPVVEPVNAAGAPLATQLWISNFDGVERSYATASSRITKGPRPRRPAPPCRPSGRSIWTRSPRPGGDRPAGDRRRLARTLLVNAWVKSGRGQNVHYAGLPVISSETQVGGGRRGLSQRRRARGQPRRHPARPDQPRRRRLPVPGRRGGRGRLAGAQRRLGGGPARSR